MQISEEIGRQMLQHGRRLHPTEIIARIDAVDADAAKVVAHSDCRGGSRPVFQAAARKYFYDKDFALAAIGPIYDLPDYNHIRYCRDERTAKLFMRHCLQSADSLA